MTSVSFTELKLGATSPALALSTEVEAEAAAWCTLLKHKRGSERTAYLKQLAHALNTEDRASLQLESRWEVVNTEDIPVRGACAWLCTCCMPGISAHGHAVRQVSYPVPVNAQDADRSWAGRSLSTHTDDGSVPVASVSVPSGSELQDLQMAIAMRGVCCMLCRSMLPVACCVLLLHMKPSAPSSERPSALLWALLSRAHFVAAMRAPRSSGAFLRVEDRCSRA